MIAEQKLHDIVASFADPISGVDLIAAGRVEAMVTTADQVVVTLAVAPSLAKDYEAVAAELSAALANALDAESSTAKAHVVLTAERVAKAASPTAGLEPISKNSGPKNQHIDTSRMRHIIAVASGKGGVGKSMVAVNLAAALAAQGLRVGLLDADIYGPSVPHMLRLQQRPDLNDDKKIMPLQVNGLKVMSMGLMVDPEKALIWRGPMVQGALVQMLRDVDWGALDYLIIDMPPGTGDAQLTLAQQVKLTGAIIVSTPQDIALIDARKAIAMFQQVRVPVLGVVENMSMFCCPACGHETAIFGTGGAKAEAQKLGVPLLAALPLLPEVRTLADAGTPPAWHGSSAVQAAYATLAAHVMAEANKQAVK